jgi:hypothetical protein
MNAILVSPQISKYKINKILLMIVLMFCLGVRFSEANSTITPRIKPDIVPIPMPLLCFSELQVALSYDDEREILTIDLSISSNQLSLWNVWLTSHGEINSKLSMTIPGGLEQPLTLPISVPYFPPQGWVGVLTTLATPMKGIVCSKFVVLDTGMPFTDSKPFADSKP